MPRATQQDVPFQLSGQDSWSGGINTSIPPEHIAKDEAVEIVNLEYDKDDYLVTRSGTLYFHSLQPALTYPERFTSMHYYENDNGDVAVLYTTGDQIFVSNNTGTVVNDRTGALVLPSDNFWQWVNYGGLAIGVNQATAGDNPVKYNGAGNAAALAGSPPRGKYIEVWNDRVWIAGTGTNSSVIFGSKLGNPEDWTDTTLDIGAVTLDVGKNDGDKITGLISFRNSLFIFKRNSIYVLSSTSSPATASSRYRIDQYTKNLGCVAPNSIKPVLDDVLFLSDSGVASLSAASLVGDLQTSLLSRKIFELTTFLRTTQDISAIVIPEVNQYWLMLPDYANPKGVSEVWVMDYQQIQNGKVRWVRFDGRVAGNVMSVTYINGARRYVIGVKEGSGVYRPYIYTPKDTTNLTDGKGNQNRPYSKKIKTRAFNLELALIRKLFDKFGLSFRTLSATLALTVQYYFDNNTQTGDIYNLTFNTSLSGGLWDIGLWDTAVWDSAQIRDVEVWKRFKEPTPTKSALTRKGIALTFIFTNAQSDQGMIFKELQFLYGILNEKGVNKQSL